MEAVCRYQFGKHLKRYLESLEVILKSENKKWYFALTIETIMNSCDIALNNPQQHYSGPPHMGISIGVFHVLWQTPTSYSGQSLYWTLWTYTCELQGSSRFWEEKGNWEPPRIQGTGKPVAQRNCIKNSLNELNLSAITLQCHLL